VVERLTRALVFRLLRRTRHGRFEIVGLDGSRSVFGEPGGPPSAVITLRRPGFARALLHGSSGLAASYADGVWECDDPVALIRLAARNADQVDDARRRWGPLLAPLHWIASRRALNTRTRSRRQIAAHYDLGNKLFELFLDESMTYSCAVFREETASLEDAQMAKLRSICDQLELGPGDHLLEIGTGWGALAVFAASERGCRVTSTTISKEQAAKARERVSEAGLEDRVTILETDYRDLDGRYSKLVSVEMIEAVGWQSFDTFFAKCGELLEPDGLMLIQAITFPDEAYELEKHSRSFIKTEIFPGGCLPSMAVMSDCVARVTRLSQKGVRDITASYVLTLREWRRRFEAQAERAAALGYDERFRRLWSFYLSYCEAGFAERRIGDVQLLLAGPGRTGAAGDARSRPSLQSG
jgi:cyclopropane-fatty-acyl-phospholipid synthase